MTVAEWRAVVRAGLRIAMLEAVEADGRAGFARVLAEALARRGQPPPVTVHTSSLTVRRGTLPDGAAYDLETGEIIG